MNEKETVTYKQHEFDIITQHIEAIMNERGDNDVLFRLRVNNALNELRVVFWKQYVGKRQSEVIEFYVPKTWKDYVKKAHRNNRLVKWWIKKHPIQTKKLSFKLEKIHIFPKIEVPHGIKFAEKIVFLEVIPNDP